MSTTFAFELNSKPTRSKTFSILLRITQNRKLKRLKTQVEIKKKSDFNPKAKNNNWIRQSEPNHKIYNEILTKELNLAKVTYTDLVSEGNASSNSIIKAIRSKEVSPSFLEYARKRTLELFESGNIGNWKRYNGFCHKLEGFLTDEKGKLNDLTFSEITPSLLSRFEAYLHSIYNVRDKGNTKKLHPNTIDSKLRIFRTLVNRAIEIDGLIKPEKNPFMAYKLKSIKTQKDKLNEDEIKMIQDIILPEGSLLWHCKNYFLFSFYCAGIRAGDFMELQT